MIALLGLIQKPLIRFASFTAFGTEGSIKACRLLGEVSSVTALAQEVMLLAARGRVFVRPCEFVDLDTILPILIK